MFSKITSKASGIAVTGLFMLTMGLGIIGSGGAVHAQENDTGGGLGEAGTCTYGSKTYSEGSKVKQDDGNIYRCQHDGTWVLGIVRPPTGTKFNQVPNAGVLQRAQ
jgi:hypothetical protein